MLLRLVRFPFEISFGGYGDGGLGSGRTVSVAVLKPLVHHYPSARRKKAFILPILFHLASSCRKKDRPILLVAIQAQATHLLTGDKRHFGSLYGQCISGVHILRPADYLGVL